jgi:ABC-type Fe3+/spermidine/putrescine transport system ATPase subunit
MLFVTHDQEEALTLGDRIAVMHNGRLEQVGTPAEVYHRPASRFVASFIGDMNFLPGSVLGATTGNKGSDVRLDLDGTVQSVEIECAVGRKVLVCVRPEQLRLGPAQGKSGRRGRVKYVGFSGDHVRYLVGLNDGTEVLAREAIEGTAARFDVGAEIGVSWPLGELLAFPG